MKVLMIHGSPRAEGNTALALKEMEGVFASEGIAVETVSIGTKAILCRCVFRLSFSYCSFL